ncbi:GNAT family N-acetyltransferase [Gottfriedia solisilvae]|uniref:N-acetyltransferase n=1 Tax=Gottfriedia solisilvae TaxID=1516104 RepID=A0A8J3AK63_9BACI|nr:GNAT family protein [Gottfriedia solisilvae]GGI15355.1 N-acetyltransferase [Gottfriedia solisilvae]
MLDGVELQHYKTEFYESLSEFSLPEEQKQFTSLPVAMLEASDGRYPIVILSESRPVGFFILHSSSRVRDYTDNTNAMLLTSFSIDHKQQGNGYAKIGLLQIEHFVSEFFQHCNEIVLAVNHKNIAAQKVYEKVGYQDTGRRKIGAIGEQFIYSYTLHRNK